MCQNLYDLRMRTMYLAGNRHRITERSRLPIPFISEEAFIHPDIAHLQLMLPGIPQQPAESAVFNIILNIQIQIS